MQVTIVFPQRPRRVTVTEDFEPEPIDTHGEEITDVHLVRAPECPQKRPALRLVAGGQR